MQTKNSQKYFFPLNNHISVDTASHKVYNSSRKQGRVGGFAFFTIREEKKKGATRMQDLIKYTDNINKLL
ncbi:MAG: hypothetical protein ACI3WS_02895, partial [Phascolarctobacterium sp.]